MASNGSASFEQHFQDLQDSRVQRTRKHPLININGSYDREQGHAAIHMVSAWARENKLSLGQVVVGEKSKEITAIPELLQLLDISGALVTIDAMGCQREIADFQQRWYRCSAVDRDDTIRFFDSRG